MGHGWRKCPYIGKAPPGAQQPAQPVAPGGGGGGGPHGMAGLLVSVPNHQQDDHQQQQGASLSAFDSNDHEDAVTVPHVPPTKWIVDTGSTRSNTPTMPNLVLNKQPVQEKVWVVGGRTSRTMAVAGVGTLHLDIKVGEEMHRLVVPGVNHVPGSVYNLLSGHDLHKERIAIIATFCFKPNSEDGELRLPAGHGMNIGAHLVDVPWVGGSYQLRGQPVYPHMEYEEVSLVNRAAREQRAAQQLHEGMGHPSHEVLAMGLEKGCAECLQSKQTKSTFGESARSPMWKPGECLNIDLRGPARVAAWQGEEMFLGMKDSSSGFSIVSLIKSKEASEVVPKIIELQKFMERQSGNPTKVIRSDRGREFLNNSLSQYCKETGIKQEVSAAHSQEQNGIAERFNRTVMEKVRTQLASSGMDNRCWGELGECLYYSVEQLNNLPSSIHEGCLTPHQAFYGHAPPDISRFRPFGAVAYVLKLPRHEEGAGKLDPVSMQGRLVGMSAMSKAYRVYVPGHGVVESCHYVRFQVDTDRKSDDMIVVDVSTQTGQLDHDQLTELPPADTVEVQLRRSNRAHKGPVRLSLLAATYPGSLRDPPRTFHESQLRPDALEWREAIRVEKQSMDGMQVMRPVSYVPRGVQVLRSMHVFTLKKDESGNVLQHKARLVIQGNMQKQGSEQLEVWAPTSKQPSLRFLLSIAAEQEMHLHQMDVKSAFLNAELDEDVYIQLPRELETGGDRQVYQLQKAVYGLKQAPRAWYNKLKDLLAGLGFQQSEADPAVYFQFMNGQLEIILTHVDDLLIEVADLNRVQWVKEQLKGLVDIKDMGPASSYLGMEISRKDGKILLTQHKYTRELLEKYSPMGLRGRDSPLEDKTQISRTAGVKLTEEKASKYRETVGALMYLQTGTRLDLAYAVGLLARFFQSPTDTTELHMDLLTSVMRYLQTTQHFGLEFGGEKQKGLVGFSDSSYSSDVDTRRSTTGYVFTYNGGAVSWSSRLQPTVA
ncbi:hypothetical protein CEUSTIGMA_g6769.t1 [Chlamydomonas eustigma]|uniref:Integrase catalytic domain-containing protein n=1 Tax=Chlamydomonas eustigma TaxID=1157962 RepID=A0A250X8C3_9CHLO|nr:hypothetical protein CEUSTIGMA_g6769.t1 [Chlamydomonas eustigma]|eukprot:GAX79328.1 hypothetical protein CEUSTIGMA_g6769.t1 [Chlamydomonas eustigma]